MRELHELLYTKIIKSGTIRLTSVLLYIMFVQLQLMTFVAFVKLLCLLLMMFVALQGLSLMTFVALQDFLYMRFVTISRIMTFVANYDVCRLEGLSQYRCIGSSHNIFGFYEGKFLLCLALVHKQLIWTGYTVHFLNVRTAHSQVPRCPRQRCIMSLFPNLVMLSCEIMQHQRNSVPKIR